MVLEIAEQDFLFFHWIGPKKRIEMMSSGSSEVLGFGLGVAFAGE